jgi:predicted RNase H-like HicB family nuclease
MSTIVADNRIITVPVAPNMFSEPISMPREDGWVRIIMQRGEDGWVMVTSPDLRSLVTQGSDEDEAIKNAIEAVDLLLEEESGKKKEFSLMVIDKE